MTKSIRFCPRCKSKDVKKNMNVLIAVGMPQLWRCNKCGFTNNVFPIITPIKSKKRKKNASST